MTGAFGIMDKLKVIKTYYESNMAKGLPEYGILGWESEEAQKLRFDMLINSVDLEGKSLLDVGCGTGNLPEYLQSKKINVAYTGVDILDKMIEKAKGKKLDAKFYHADIFKENIFEDRSFDVLYASGIFNLNLGNNKEFLVRALDLFFRLTTEAVVFNLLHKASPNREDKYFYFDPDEVIEIINSLSGREEKNLSCSSSNFSMDIEKVEIVEAYLNNDFTVVCRKTQK